MTFNSPVFFLFLTIVTVINYLLPQRYRLIWLLFSSYWFIGSNSILALLFLLLFSWFNFIIASKIIINRSYYLLAISLNVLAILGFNYFNLTENGLQFNFATIHFNVQRFIIAVGFSYYSLQNIAYLTEVHFKRISTIQDWKQYFLYNSFFAKIISGPIMLPKEFFSQLPHKKIPKELISKGCNRIMLGLIKKLVIADRLGPSVSSIFDYNSNYCGLTTIGGAYLFTVQLYFDFSGYTDIAIGSANLLGYELKENFCTPFRSKSIAEFWRRWHIALISWFSNYIYYPLVYHFKKLKRIGVSLGIAITFALSGIWHGIGATFLFWALCHIFYLSIELFTSNFRNKVSEYFNGKLYKALCAFVVFNAVCFSNIFFRSHSMHSAMQMIKNIFTFSNFIPSEWLSKFIAPLAIGGHQIDEFNFYLSICLFVCFLFFENRINQLAFSQRLQLPFIIISILLITTVGIFNSGAQFIYMQF